MKVKNIRVDHVFVSEFNCRKNLDDLDIENLANSIKKYGLFQNIVVFKKGKNLYELIIGQRRLLAFKFLRRKTIPAKILEEVDDLDALAISLQEDIHKVGLTPLDKARSFRTLYKLLGEDVSRVAAKVAKSIQTVRNYLKMLKIESSVQKKIDQGRIKLPVRTLVQIPDLPKDKQEIVAEYIQNYPGDVQRTIMRELKKEPSKLKIIEQKELIANFIRKVITFRLPRLQDISRRFFDDLREIEHNFRNMTDRFPILRVTLDFHPHSFQYSRDLLKRIVHDFDEKMSFRDRRNHGQNPLELLDATLEDFRRNTQDYNTTIIRELLNDLMEMVANDIFDKKILETLKAMRSDFSDIIDNRLPDLLRKIVDIRIPPADRIELFKIFEELYLNDHLDLIKHALQTGSKSSYFLGTILGRLTLQPCRAKVFKEIPNLLVYLYMTRKDDGVHKNLVSILRKIGKLCYASGCTALTNLFKGVSEIRFCSSCKGTYCDTCFDEHSPFLKCGHCGRYYCYNCRDFCEPLSASSLENEACEICYEEGKYEDVEAICRECVIQVSPCYVCGKRLCTEHRRYKKGRVLCSECYDDYEEEEEEKVYDEFDDDIFNVLEENYSYIEEFVINDCITLKLADNNQIDLFVNGELFNQCMYLFFNISEDNYKDYKYIDSVDEAAEILDTSMEGEGRIDIEISPETEFWGHCSNLQVWAENNYDTRLIHRNLAFPLLKRLTEVGDPIARRVFKEEIAKRIESGHLNIITFLLENNYFRFLNNNELKIVFENTAEKIERNILNSLTSDNSSQIEMAIRILKKIEEINLESDENDKSTEEDKDK